MTLPSSGTIGLQQIGAEKGISAPFGLVAMSTTNINQASASKPDGVAPHKISEFYGYNQNATASKIATPTCTASWDLGAHVMDVSVTPTGTPPAGTVWTFTSSLGNAGSCTEPTRAITVSEPEDGALECWTVHGSATGWTTSDESAQSCANRGNPQ